MLRKLDIAQYAHTSQTCKKQETSNLYRTILSIKKLSSYLQFYWNGNIHIIKQLPNSCRKADKFLFIVAYLSAQELLQFRSTEIVSEALFPGIEAALKYLGCSFIFFWILE